MIFVPFISLVTLFILTKIMGYRQISQLNMFDYIIGITIGSIAAEIAMNDLSKSLRLFIAMIVYALITVLISVLCVHSQKVRTFIDGSSIILYENDMIYNKQLRKAKLDIDEFLMQCRIRGYFDLKELKMIVLEVNGNLSFYPKEKYRPTVVDDLNLEIKPGALPIILIKEGNVFKDNLKKINKDEKWLSNTIDNMGVNIEDILLLYQEENSNIQLYKLNELKKNFN